MPSERVEYGETFTTEQADRHRAPSVNDKGQQFEYRDIVNTKTNEHIAKCYSERFTFAVWNDYTITPFYSDTPTTIEGEGRYITVDYIDTSRNQWGTEVFDDEDESDRSDVSDKLVADLDITFNDNGIKILSATDEHGNYLYKLGMMFEVCGTTEDGTFDKTQYKDGEANMTDRVRSLIEANTGAYGPAKIGGVNCYYSKIEITPETVSTFNRSEFARSFNTSAVGNKVLRMYAYMQTPDGEIVVSDPQYITMYDYAKHNLAFDVIDAKKKAAKNGEAYIHGFEGDRWDIVIPEKFLDKYNVTEVEEYAFFENSTMEKLDFEEAAYLRRLGDSSFSRCTALREVYITESIQELGTGVFDGCTSLSVARFFKDSAADIPRQCFYGCSSLVTVEFYNEPVSIGPFAFAKCSAPERLEIPESVTEISDNAFEGCDKLVIYCNKGSYAHRYAADKNIPYVLLDAGSEEYILGDTDGNGDVDVVDATWLQRYAALMDVSIIEETVMHGDVDGDGDPSVVDATFILRYCVSIATPYAIGESVEQ